MARREIPLSRFSCALAGCFVMGTALSALAVERKAPVVPKSRPAGPVQRGPATPQAQPPTTAQPAIARPERPHRLMGPDLVVPGFSLVPGRWQTEGAFATAPFWVTVKNAGNVQVDKPFHVTLQYASAGNPTWQGENDGNNCWKVTALPLRPGQTYRFQARLKVLSSAVSDRTLRLRALADYECFTDIPAPNGDIAETSEHNNFSNELSVSAGYLPTLTSVNPSVCPRDSECVVNGQGLGSEQGSHTVVVEQGAHKTAVTIKSWANAQVHFVLQPGVGLGDAQIYIAEGGTLNKISSALPLTVAQMTSLPWADLLSSWNDLRESFSLRLNTWEHGPTPNNTSQLNVLFKTLPIDVPLVEKNNWAGHYRFLLNDMKSANGGITLSRDGCLANQLRLNVVFESEGTEAIGYYKVKGPAGEWRRAGAPDIQIDDGKLGILFALLSTAGGLDYTVYTTFAANVHANNSAADDIMDYFMGGWDGEVTSKMKNSVTAGLMKPEIKTQVIDSFMLLIRTKAKIPASQAIRKMEFTGDAIKITSY